MNKTKKNRTFTLLKIVFPVRGSPKESLKQSMMIEMLENIYLCGINNNVVALILPTQCVVICLKISTFVVSTTT